MIEQIAGLEAVVIMYLLWRGVWARPALTVPVAALMPLPTAEPPATPPPTPVTGETVTIDLVDHTGQVVYEINTHRWDAPARIGHAGLMFHQQPSTTPGRLVYREERVS